MANQLIGAQRECETAARSGCDRYGRLLRTEVCAANSVTLQYPGSNGTDRSRTGSVKGGAHSCNRLASVFIVGSNVQD